MAKPAFDPSKPFEANKPPFDPSQPFEKDGQLPAQDSLTRDQYNQMSDADKMKMAMSNVNQMKESSGVAQDSALNTMALNYLPQIKAKLGQVFSGERIANDDSYLKRRDQVLSDMKSGAEKYPLQNAAGIATGIIAPMAAGPALKGLGLVGSGASALAGSDAAQGMLGAGEATAEAAPQAAGTVPQMLARPGVLKTVGKAALKGTATGAAYGAASNPGDQAGVVDPIQAGQRVQNAKIGAVLGGTLSSAFAGAPYAADMLNDIANTKAFKAGGAMLRDFRKTNDRGLVEDTGQFMFDNGLVKPGDTYETIGNKARQLVNQTGEDLGKGYNAASKIIEKLPEETQNKIAQAGFNPVRDKAAILSKVESELQGNPNKKAVLSHVSGYLDDLSETYGDRALDPGEANKLKGVLDKTAINWERNPLSRDPDKEIGYKVVRRTLGDKISNQIQTIGDNIGNPEAAKNLQNLNRKYGMASQIANMAEDKVSREEAKSMFGMSDMGATGTGAAIGTALLGPVGTPLGAAAGYVAGKATKAYGPAMIATGTKTAANLASKIPSSISGATLGRGMSNILNSTESGSMRNLIPSLPAAKKDQPQNQSPAQSQPLKGQDKWANDGADKVQDHVEQDQNSDLDAELFSDKDAMLENPKVKSLLIQASDLKPGSRAMAQIVSRIKSQLGKANA